MSNSAMKQTNKQTPWPLVRKRTIPTERPPLVGQQWNTKANLAKFIFILFNHVFSYGVIELNYLMCYCCQGMCNGLSSVCFVAMSCLEYLHLFSLWFYNYLRLWHCDCYLVQIFSTICRPLSFLIRNWSLLKPCLVFLLPVGTWEAHR
jgi:hypothetical protein